MFARRFTIVCLLITVFGMGLSILVADRTMRSYSGGGFLLPCEVVEAASCLAAPRR